MSSHDGEAHDVEAPVTAELIVPAKETSEDEEDHLSDAEKVDEDAAEDKCLLEVDIPEWRTFRQPGFYEDDVSEPVRRSRSQPLLASFATNMMPATGGATPFALEKIIGKEMALHVVAFAFEVRHLRFQVRMCGTRCEVEGFRLDKVRRHLASLHDPWITDCDMCCLQLPIHIKLSCAHCGNRLQCVSPCPHAAEHI